MPSSKTIESRGLEFTVTPKSWSHRVARIPFYFENSNPSFRVDIKRVSEENPSNPWPAGQITIETIFEDNTRSATLITVEDLTVGETAHTTINNVIAPRPGQVLFRIPLTQAEQDLMGVYVDERQQVLFAYTVRTEESLWVAILSPLILLAGVFLGTWFGSQLQSPPQVNVSPAPVIVQLPTQPPPPPTAATTPLPP